MIYLLDENIQFIPEKGLLVSESGKTVNLSENSYRFLKLLLEGESSKQTIINQIWHEQRGVVSDSSYYGQIHSLRKSFELVGLPGSLIKTIPRRGVKYIGKVSTSNYNSPVNLVTINDTETPVTSTLISSSQNLSFIDKNSKGIHSRRNLDRLFSILAVIAVCWLATLTVVVFRYLISEGN
ncbi:winged helix-turn-helix domain-containing protein [Erwinia tasmaniensis]|uniref:winged helix-turn-helix domain-containing protein n=1 Tax=Erwinia tasmaniensis TaxID=338565 RepID=UPI003A4D59A0